MIASIATSLSQEDIHRFGDTDIHRAFSEWRRIGPSSPPQLRESPVDFRVSKAMVVLLRERWCDACDHRGFLSMSEIVRRFGIAGATIWHSEHHRCRGRTGRWAWSHIKASHPEDRRHAAHEGNTRVQEHNLQTRHSPWVALAGRDGSKEHRVE